MSEKNLSDEYKLDSIYIIESLFKENGNIISKRGTCFSVSENLLLTAYHVIKGSSDLRIYQSSDSYIEEEHIIVNCIYFNEESDIAILEMANEPLDSFIALYSTSVSLDNEVKSCGYPAQKEHHLQYLN